MTHTFFGGATIPLGTDFDDAGDINKDQPQLTRHALVDHLEIDLDSAMVRLGPVARKFHGIVATDERIGLRRFVESYAPSCRGDLLSMIEKLAGTQRPFHFIASMAAPAGAFVHGFISPGDATPAAGTWTGLLVMARQDAREPAILGKAS
ncbi:hypothetical protein [Oricola sp.]|uniref:hypothetical protein n=1 Tax=Oricola sp. TaxID=1979950 RepID=UPI0025D21FB6|nr:hypothetical protein [Oricola sp.]MCI5077876.1 hypothetical protein [Oricola sp.]